MPKQGPEHEGEPPIGTRLLSASGRIWTVRSITPRGSRVVITCDLPDGDHGAVVDFTAISKMVALEAAPALRPLPTARYSDRTTSSTARVPTLTDTGSAHR